MGLEQGKPPISEAGPKQIRSFEPFVSPGEEKKGTLFVNEYNGHYSQAMELNREAVETVLRIAHLDGPVFLTSMPYSRGRSLDANSDGSVSAKNSLFSGKKIDEENENPHMKIASLPVGWKIEVNDQAIMANLMERKLDPQNRQKVFIKEFNGLIINGLWDCIAKEKLSNIKDKYFKNKRIWSIIYPAVNAMAVLISQAPLRSIAVQSSALLLTYAFINYLSLIRAKDARQIEESLREHGANIDHDSNFISRKVDHPWELVMPMIEIDKVIESFAYLSTAGRTLVREKNSFDKPTLNPLE